MTTATIAPTLHEVTVPPVFFEDTVSCICFRDEFTEEAFGPVTKRKVRATLTSRDAYELYNRAEHYAQGEEYDFGLRASARATVRALDKQLDISAVYDEAKAVRAAEVAAWEAEAAAAALAAQADAARDAA